MLSDKYYLIANPKSGNSKLLKDWKTILNILQSKSVNFDYIFTESKFHAVKLAEQAYINGYRKFIVAGGDGTLNEVINGLHKFPKEEYSIGIIPVGTGNDWIRTHGINSDYSKSVDAILKNNIKFHDLGKVTYYDGNLNKEHYFINVLGGGFDAAVAFKVNLDKDENKSTPFTYYINLIKVLFNFKPIESIVYIDDKVINTKVFSFAAGICKFNGKGMKQTPNADPFDGLLDVTLIKDITIFEVIQNIQKLFSGKFITHKKVETFKCNTFEISSKDQVKFEVDGESLGCLPIRVEIIPQAIPMLVP
jgi:YegS/Rv2252/BmrU family lipid kinase